jgi:hypothetical protein
LAEDEGKAEVQGDDPVPDALLDDLEARIAAGDFGALAVFLPLAGRLRQQFGPHVDALASALRSFAHEPALALLRALRD